MAPQPRPGDTETHRPLVINESTGETRVPLENAISTTKYKWYTWLPKSLWEQFRRIANAYFLFISALMLIGTYATFIFESPLDPFSVVFTLMFVLLVTSVKEGVEDLDRAKSDKFENNRDVTVVSFENGEIKETRKLSQDINPGDIVKLEGKVPVPVDLLLIMTSMYDDGNKCYIETANIDGETNLKLKEAPAGLYDHFAALIAKGKPVKEFFTGKMLVDVPNKNIHNFTGNITLGDKEIPLGPENLILRSSLFCNTDWAYGVAVYTGQETKIQMNNRKAPSKMSRIEKNLNDAILIIFVAQVVLVTISVISIYIMGFERYDKKLPYVYPNDADTGSVLPLWLDQWFVFFLLYNNFIPISIYVTIEMVNLGQGYLIASDEQLYREELDVACLVKSSNLVQELGMVSNIFSDKTGTLTRNEMKLVKYVIDGVIYDIEWLPNAGKVIDETREHAQIPSGLSPTSAQKLHDFMRCLTTCHTVIREKDGTYRAESPDELALIEGVGNYGCYLHERGTKEMSIAMFGKNETFEILAVNPFNADRKRMSILIKEKATDRYFVMCKGADNIMIPLCKLDMHETQGLDKSLTAMSQLGLRTLVIAQKELTALQAWEWLETFKAATLSTVDREDHIAKAGALLEVEMTLTGLTAIEDRLQDEVPEVIADLAKAGIILWMLTGDKLETAINIGRSCNLILTDTELVRITHIDGPAHFADALEDAYVKLTDSKNENVEYALVIDGPSFLHMDYYEPEQRRKFLVVGQRCRSVISCRLTPTQKRELVMLVKKDLKPKATCLAIGDGANDVSMILEGNVGVGIFGKEGRQAANNADFAIGEFKFLRRMLLVHGRWNYVRQSKVFLYCMHKNMVLTLTLFWFSYYTAVSGTSLYESWIYSGFNFILGLPIVFFGILDRDLSEEFVLAHPEVYQTGRTDSLLNFHAIGLWIWNAILYAIIISMLSFYVLVPTFSYMGLYEAGTIVFTGLCMALQCKVAFLHHQWARPNVLAMALSVIGMLCGFLMIASTTDAFYYVAQHDYGLAIYWFFGFFAIPLIAVMIDMIGYDIYLFFYPTPEMQYREIMNSDKLSGVQMVSPMRKPLLTDGTEASQLDSEGNNPLRSNTSSAEVPLQNLKKHSSGSSQSGEAGAGSAL